MDFSVSVDSSEAGVVRALAHSFTVIIASDGVKTSVDAGVVALAIVELLVGILVVVLILAVESAVVC